MFNTKALEVVDFLRYNNADIDWYMKMPTNAPPVDPKVEIPLEICEEECVILEQIFPTIDNLLSQVGMLEWE